MIHEAGPNALRVPLRVAAPNTNREGTNGPAAPSSGGRSAPDFATPSSVTGLAWDRVAVLVEPRSHPCIAVVVRSVLHYLGEGWGLQIFHGPHNLEYVMDALTLDCSGPGPTCVHDETVLDRVQFNDMRSLYEGVLHNTTARKRDGEGKSGNEVSRWPDWLLTKWEEWTAEMDDANSKREEWSVTREVYSQILLSSDFWMAVGGDTALIFQTDAFLCRTGIEAYLGYDYVGAPWKLCIRDNKPEQGSYLCVGGNGGLSIRRRSTMLKLIEEGRRSSIMEDFQFASWFQGMPGLGSSSGGDRGSSILLLPFSESRDVFVETVTPGTLDLVPLGVHKPYAYLQKHELERLLTGCMADLRGPVAVSGAASDGFVSVGNEDEKKTRLQQYSDENEGPSSSTAYAASSTMGVKLAEDVSQKQGSNNERCQDKSIGDGNNVCSAESDQGVWPYEQVILNDLEPFNSGISKSMLNSAPDRFSVVKYQIIDGRLYRTEKCGFPSRCRGIEHFLLEILAEKHSPLPDLEMIVNVADYPLVNRRAVELGAVPAVPVFSFSKTAAFLDVHFPAWTFWEGGPAINQIYPTGIGRWDIALETMTASASEHPWESKERIGFFRGSRTSSERDPLILLSRRTNRTLVDAAYIKNQSWKSNADTLGETPVEPVTMEEHCRYKYLFNFRGVAASFRFKYLFLCGSLVFHILPPDEKDHWQEFFYYPMKPWKHYIPVTAGDGMEDAIEELLRHFHNHDKEARQIARAGRDFILSNLQMEDVRHYWKVLMEKYASLLDFDVIRDPTMKALE